MASQTYGQLHLATYTHTSLIHREGLDRARSSAAGSSPESFLEQLLKKVIEILLWLRNSKGFEMRVYTEMATSSFNVIEFRPEFLGSS